MYESYWHLECKPFSNGCDPRFYYPCQSHQAALLKLRYVLENRRGGAILAGPSGSGKTLLAGMLRKMLGEAFRPQVHLVFPQMDAEELLAYLADELTSALGEDKPARRGRRLADVGGTQPAILPWQYEPGRSVHQSVRQIEQSLAENTRQGRHAVVLIDEAHLIETPRTLETLRLLLNFEPEGQPGLSLLLLGQPGILPTIDRMPHLEERLGAKCLLRPFTERETAEYVDHRLHVAGAAESPFEPESLAALHHLTHGIARRINRLADLALLIGYAEQQRTIRADQLESVSEELVAVVPE